MPKFVLQLLYRIYPHDRRVEVVEFRFKTSYNFFNAFPYYWYRRDYESVFDRVTAPY